MAEISDLSGTDSLNTARFPEGQAPSTVNNGARALEGLIARWHRDTNASLSAGGTGDAITVAANQTLTAYHDGLAIAFNAGAANTTATTLSVDSVGAKKLFKNFNQELVANDIKAGQKVVVIYDADGDSSSGAWQLVSPLGNAAAGFGANTFTGVQRWAKGADVASQNALALGTDGNYFDITGTTAIASIGSLGVGTVAILQFDSALTLTHHSTDLVLPTGANITTTAGDHVILEEYASGDWRCIGYFKASGEPIRKTESFIVAASDETTAITAGTDKVKFRMPYAFTVSTARASLSTTQSSGNIFTVDIHESGTTILSTKLTIDNGEKTSTTAVVAPVISDSTLADDAEITIDVDQIGDGTAKGLKIVILGYRTQ